MTQATAPALADTPACRVIASLPGPRRSVRPGATYLTTPLRYACYTSRTTAYEGPTMTSVIPPDLRALTRRAEALCLLGRETPAADLLRPVLTVLDPRTAAPDAGLVGVALTYLSCTYPSPHRDELAVPWARYAMEASETLNGPTDPHTTAAATFLIDLLHTIDDIAVPDGGRHDELLRASRLIVDGRAHAHGPGAPVTLFACIQRAGLLHQLGHCKQGITEATDACMRWWSRHGTDDGQILHALAAMLFGCGHTHRATGWLALHVALAPSPDEAVRRLMQALTLVLHPLADPHHRGVCGAHHAVTYTTVQPSDQVLQRHGGRCTTARRVRRITGARPDGRDAGGQVRP